MIKAIVSSALCDGGLIGFFFGAGINRARDDFLERWSLA